MSATAAKARTLTISFVVRGLPKAQPRARSRKGLMGVYDPGTADGWKALVVGAAREHRPSAPLDVPLRVSIDFLFPRPKSLMRAKDPEGELYHTGRPDRDNLDKAVLDALKQDGWFRDDSLACAGEIRKLYHAKSGVPGARVTITELA
ncbi:MAG TPA: RusA family crossover junction endodeoxyribonuclease [Steroidobacteraceae bacterium]|nr:RusA family crossover junction endodeoxyribonuclease [Steroidobacteraceae bacterium]